MPTKQSTQEVESLPLVDWPSSPQTNRQLSSAQLLRRKPLPPSTSLPHPFPGLSEFQRYSQLESEEDDDSITRPNQTKYPAPIVPDHERIEHSDLTSWIPSALRLPSLTALLLFNILLLFAVIVLHVRSNTNLGIATDDGSASITFSWRFVPTLVAVVYVFMWMVVMDNVNRTEPFARMSRPGGSTVQATLLRGPGEWWSALADSFPRRKSNHRGSLVLFSAVMAYVLGFLIISPLSSSLLSPQDVLAVQEVSFLHPQLDTSTLLQPTLGTVGYFRSIGNILQNVTTSPWISDRYAVIPFYPSLDEAFYSSVPAVTQTWRTKGTIFEAGLDCEIMAVQGPINSTFDLTNRYENGTVYRNYNTTLQTVSLSSPTGCEYGFAIAGQDFSGEFSYWSNLTNSDLPLGWQGTINITDTENLVTNTDVLLNSTEACGTKHIMLSSIRSQSTQLEIKARLCKSTFMVGVVDVEASTNNNATSFTFDEHEYERVRLPVQDSVVNVTGFQKSFLQGNWTNHLQQLGLGATSTTLPFWGPATLIGALHEFNVTAMLFNPEIERQAKIIQQRALGEAILESLSTVQLRSTTPGEVLTTERRVVVLQVVAYIIEVVLAVQLCLGLALFFRGCGNRRRLGVSQDVGFTNTIASLVSSKISTTEKLRELHRIDRKVLPKLLANNVSKIETGNLDLGADKFGHHGRGRPEYFSQKHAAALIASSSMPSILSIWSIGCLGLLLGFVLVAIAVLYRLSLDDGLYQSFFVHQTTIQVGSTQLGTLATISIIPTFVGVIVGLWWGAIESYFRKIQPYIEMARGPTIAMKGAGLSYQSSYIVWGAFRAISRKHSLLALMCTGALLTEILTIAMSALWQTQPSHLSSTSELIRGLELRQIPHVNYNTDSYKSLVISPVLEQLFKDLRTNWMYSATLELTLNGSEPTWSKDGWSFVPLDVESLSIPSVTNETVTGNSSLASTATNATFSTPAIRARLECEPWPSEENPWWLLETDDVANNTKWKSTPDPSRYAVGYSFHHSLPLIPGGGIPLCCAEGTMETPGNATLGYWVLNHEDSGWADKNFSIKWITGVAQIFEYKDYTGYSTSPRFTWLEKPTVAAANCTPIIEAANSTIVVDVNTARIQSFQILDTPTVEEIAWTDSFVMHDDNPQNYTRVQKNVTTSYGYLFTQALLKASQLNMLNSYCKNYTAGCLEDLEDETFNIRQPGLNMDFMTYSMTTLAKNRNLALSDPGVLISLAQQTFAIFFQHFASSNLTSNGDGGWVYQRVNATLPYLDGVNGTQNQTTMLKRSTDAISAVAQVIVDRPVEMLVLSPTAVWLSICILVWLLVTTILILVVKTRYFSPILRKIDTVADVAILVAGSERYLALARHRGMDGLQKNKNFQTRLGWFRTSTGEVRWGIELVDEEVDWLTEEEVAALERPPKPALDQNGGNTHRHSRTVNGSS